MTQAILSVRGLVNRFGSQLVHDDVSFDIMRGEIIGIIGGSGAGKTVLLRSLFGLHKPNAGEVLLAGMPVAGIAPAEIAGQFGVLFQDGALFSSLTVGQNIMLPLNEHSALPQQAKEMLVQLKLSLVGLDAGAALKYPSELSGGMTKRAALARALALDPVMLFLDEPTAGLDPVSASGFDKLIVDLNRSLGVTVALVTHDLDTLFMVCDRVAALVNKKVIIDTLSNLRQIDEPWIRSYFDGPRAQGAFMAAQEAHGNQ